MYRAVFLKYRAGLGSAVGQAVVVKRVLLGSIRRFSALFQAIYAGVRDDDLLGNAGFGELRARPQPLAQVV